MCSVAFWSLKALTGGKNLPDFLKIQSSEGQEIGIGRTYKKKIRGGGGWGFKLGVGMYITSGF